MGRLKKRSAAALVLALSAALSVFVGGGWKLRRERAAAEDVFFNGSAGFSVYNDLLELRESGYNLLRVSESLRGAEEEQRAAASAWARLDEAKKPEQYADAFWELYEAVGALDRALTESGAVLPDSWGCSCAASTNTRAICGLTATTTQRRRRTTAFWRTRWPD